MPPALRRQTRIPVQALLRKIRKSLALAPSRSKRGVTGDASQASDPTQQFEPIGQCVVSLCPVSKRHVSI
jgi:hypothetical protein